MIAAMRPDIDNIDEYVRNTTARAFSVVASALGIPALLPFLKAVCLSKKSWQARHTGIKIVQQIAILLGVAVLPHLKSLVEIIKHGLTDENQKVKTITALTVAALAEAAAPYGIESFDDVLEPLWKGIRLLRGKVTPPPPFPPPHPSSSPSCVCFLFAILRRLAFVLSLNVCAAQQACI